MQKAKQIYSYDELPVIMDITLAALLLGYDEEYLTKMARQKKFPAFQPFDKGGGWRIHKEDLLSWLQEKREKVKNIA